MGITVITGPVVEPVTLAEAKAHLRIDTIDDDALVTSYIIAARMYAEEFCRRRFITQTLELSMDELIATELPYPPLQSITSITYLDSSAVSQVLASDQYTVDTKSLVGKVVPAYGVTWPVTYEQVNAIAIRYVAGYGSSPSDVPEPIKAAILLHIELLHDRDPTMLEALENARDSLLYLYRVITL